MRRTVIVDWLWRVAVVVLAVLWVRGLDGAGRILVVYYSVLSALLVPAMVIVVAMTLSDRGIAALRARPGGLSWRGAIAEAGTSLWSASIVAIFAWMNHPWVAASAMFCCLARYLVYSVIRHSDAS